MQETDTLLTVPNRYTPADDTSITNIDTKSTSTSTLKKSLLIIGLIAVILFGAYAYKNSTGTSITSSSIKTHQTDKLVDIENDDSLLIDNSSSSGGNGGELPDGTACVDICLQYCPFPQTVCTEACEDGSFCVDTGLVLCSSEPISAYCEMQ